MPGFIVSTVMIVEPMNLKFTHILVIVLHKPSYLLVLPYNPYQGKVYLGLGWRLMYNFEGFV